MKTESCPDDEPNPERVLEPISQEKAWEVAEVLGLPREQQITSEQREIAERYEKFWKWDENYKHIFTPITEEYVSELPLTLKDPSIVTGENCRGISWYEVIHVARGGTLSRADSKLDAWVAEAHKKMDQLRIFYERVGIYQTWNLVDMHFVLDTSKPEGIIDVFPATWSVDIKIDRDKLKEFVRSQYRMGGGDLWSVCSANIGRSRLLKDGIENKESAVKKYPVKLVAT